MRKFGVPGRTFGAPSRILMGGAPGIFGGAFSGAPKARFLGSSGRRRGLEIDHPRRPGRGLTFGATLVTCRAISGRYVRLGFRDVLSGNPGGRFSGSRRECIWGGPWGFQRRVFGRPDPAFHRWFRVQTAGAEVLEQFFSQDAPFRANV